MTVRELIVELQKCDQDAQVFYPCSMTRERVDGEYVTVIEEWSPTHKVVPATPFYSEKCYGVGVR
jgi:hypothetical protein